MQLFCHVLGRTVAVHMRREDRVADLKLELQDKAWIRAEVQTLMVQGRVLDDDDNMDARVLGARGNTMAQELL